MRTINRLHRSGIAVEPARPISSVARIMEASGIGTVAIIDGTDLVGIVTDRDLVRRGLARDLPPDTRVDGLMSAPVVTFEADADIHDAIEMFNRHAIRRLAVVEQGGFVGILSLDDLLLDMAGDLVALATPLSLEILSPGRDAPLPATR